MLSELGGARMAEEAFSDELLRLKRQGASVLVTGSSRSDHRRNAYRRLMGCTADRVRRRVVVSTTDTHHYVSQVLADVDPETLSVIAYGEQTRGVAPSGPTPGPSNDGSITKVDTLADLGVAISSAIDAFETDASELEPAEVRVGIDSLLPLLEEYGAQRVFKFLHLINGRTQHIHGMSHCHLPVNRDAAIVPMLSPLFDVVVERRERHGDTQERWILDDGAHCSGWLSTTRE